MARGREADSPPFARDAADMRHRQHPSVILPRALRRGRSERTELFRRRGASPRNTSTIGNVRFPRQAGRGYVSACAVGGHGGRKATQKPLPRRELSQKCFARPAAVTRLVVEVLHWAIAIPLDFHRLGEPHSNRRSRLSSVVIPKTRAVMFTGRRMMERGSAASAVGLRRPRPQRATVHGTARARSGRRGAG